MKIKFRHKTARHEHHSHKITNVLRALPDHFMDADFTVADLREALHGRVYGFFILIFALPNLLPMPGISTVMSVPLVMLFAQMLMGRRHPWFPAFVLRRTMKTSFLAMLCRRAIPVFERIERLSYPRALFMHDRLMMRMNSLMGVLLSILLLLPIPFGNALPAVSLCCFAVGMILKDGIITGLGVLGGVICLTVLGYSVDVLASLI